MDTSLLGNNQPTSSKRKYIVISAIALFAVVGIIACHGNPFSELPVLQEEDTKHVLTFKNPECIEQHLELFQEDEDYQYLKNIGILIVNKKIDDLNADLEMNKELNDCVDTIEADQTVTIDDPPCKQDVNQDEYYQWHLKRISIRQLPLNNVQKFEQNSESHVYIIDSGIDGRHSQLKMYVAQGATQNKGFTSDVCCETAMDPLCDCGGHGTHCAGLVASEIAGYNQFTTLHSAKVFNWMGSAAYSTILNAMDWVQEQYTAEHSHTPGVVSMSLGGGYYAAMNVAVESLYNANLFVVTAAGNSNKDACSGSPSSSEHSFTVGSSNIKDFRSSFSEYGDCVDTFAPGEQIYSTAPDQKFQYMSGTSMATPLVAGMASYFATRMQTKTPAELKFVFQCLATQDVVQDAKTKMNILPFDDVTQYNPKAAHCQKQLEENPEYQRFVEMYEI